MYLTDEIETMAPQGTGLFRYIPINKPTSQVHTQEIVSENSRPDWNNGLLDHLIVQLGT